MSKDLNPFATPKTPKFEPPKDTEVVVEELDNRDRGAGVASTVSAGAAPLPETERLKKLLGLN